MRRLSYIALVLLLLLPVRGWCAIAKVGTCQTATGTATHALTVTAPAGSASGSYVVLSVVQYGSGSVTSNPTASGNVTGALTAEYNSGDQLVNGLSVHGSYSWFDGVLTGSDASFAVTCNNGVNVPVCTAVACVFSGENTTTPLDPGASAAPTQNLHNSATSTAGTATGLTTSVNNDMVVSVFMQSKASGNSVSWSTPASVTTNVGLNTVSNASTGMFYGLLATAGATGNLTSTSTNQWGAVLLAIQPAAATPTPTPTPTATPTAGASFHGDGLTWWSRLATPIPSWQMTPVIMGNN